MNAIQPSVVSSLFQAQQFKTYETTASDSSSEKYALSGEERKGELYLTRSCWKSVSITKAYDFPLLYSTDTLWSKNN